MRRPWAVVGVALAVGVSACGGGPGPGISEPASNELALRVQAVRQATLSGDRAAVLTRLGELRSAVSRLRHRDELSGDRADAVLAAAADVEALVDTVPTTTTTTTTVPPPELDDEGGEDDEGRDRGRGRGRGD